MLVVLSPSKTLDFESKLPPLPHTTPSLLSDTKKLAGVLKDHSAKKLQNLMGISDKLAALNYERYQTMSFPFTADNARQALLAFKGDVYTGIDVASYTKKDFAFAQDHVRILSGLYGVLRPLDLMQPYRLEMGTRLPTKSGKNLYEFWGSKLSETLNDALKTSGGDTLINLASEEYFKAVDQQAFKGTLLTIHFKQRRGNQLKTIGLLAKRARGDMTHHIITHRITKPDALKDYDKGYIFDEQLSDSSQFTFVEK